MTEDPATSPIRPSPGQPALSETAGRSPADALTALASRAGGLTTAEATQRRALFGANVLRAHGVSAVEVLLRQLRSYLLALLLVAAAVSALVGDVTEAAIIVGIMAMSVGLGFANEYRSERAVEALHDQIQHLAGLLPGPRQYVCVSWRSLYWPTMCGWLGSLTDISRTQPQGEPSWSAGGSNCVSRLT